MCRILLVRSNSPFNIIEQLQPFAAIAENSREYQGHGWGCSWLTEERQWQHYHNIQPVWQDDLSRFSASASALASASAPASTSALTSTLLLVHARSAFRDEGIAVENNMPFFDGESVFIFNGELRGVKIKSEGRIGAEKIFNYIRRMDKGDKLQALDKAVSIINRRTQYVRAMNILMSDGEQCLVSSTYNEDPDYFQMYRSERDGIERVCSEPFPGHSDWQPIANQTTAIV